MNLSELRVFRRVGLTPTPPGHANLMNRLRPPMLRTMALQRVKSSWNSMIPWSSAETTIGAEGTVTP